MLLVTTIERLELYENHTDTTEQIERYTAVFKPLSHHNLYVSNLSNIKLLSYCHMNIVSVKATYNMISDIGT